MSLEIIVPEKLSLPVGSGEAKFLATSYDKEGDTWVSWVEKSKRYGKNIIIIRSSLVSDVREGNTDTDDDNRIELFEEDFVALKKLAFNFKGTKPTTVDEKK